MSHARGSLRRRLTAICTTLTVAALVATGIDSWNRERTTLEEDTANRLQTLANMVALNTRSGVEFDGVDDVLTFLDTVMALTHVQAIAVYTHEGTRFAAAGQVDLLPAHRDLDFFPAEDAVARAPLSYKDSRGDERVGQVLVRASGEPTRARLAVYLRRLLATNALALFALGFTAWWLVSRLLKPIADLVRTTNEVRRTEDYSLRAERTADDEVGTLVAAFNAMLEAISARDAHLAGNAERLEHQVRERTAELRRALDAAESSTRAKSTFVANMSHEIRTPLNAILGMAELALEAEDPKELREYLGVIRSAGSNLLGVLCDILDLSKIESDRLELSAVPTELESLLLDALRPLTARTHSKDLEISCSVDPALAAGYRVDDVRMRQVLTNLVGNAIKFTESGFVHVAVRRRSTGNGGFHHVEFAVKDSGVGIPADRQRAIFEPFTQADSTITRRFAGTGLGLHITDRLVRLMGGSIDVQSQVGIGTTFTVVVPLEPCDSPLPPAPAVPAGTRIVLVSRSEMQRTSFAALAARLPAGFLALDSLDALAAACPLQPGTVVVADDRDPDHDVSLCTMVPPDADGVRPLLLATVFQELATTAARCRDHSYAGYVTKPVSSRELALRIARPGPAAGASITPSAAPTQAPVHGLRILVAEDNAVNQKLIQRILVRDGHDVTIAPNGRVCCDAWSRSSFDLVLMDMQMPEMSGLQATEEIRRAEKGTGHRIPIVALTANTTVEDRRACLDAGMDEVLPKPVSIPKLRATIARYGGSTFETMSTNEARVR
ncbi:MAG: response regulator [Planctomycetes bacterium]|nr:response regulator [Planctomycetota bacterium]